MTANNSVSVPQFFFLHMDPLLSGKSLANLNNGLFATDIQKLTWERDCHVDLYVLYQQGLNEPNTAVET